MARPKTLSKNAKVGSNSKTTLHHYFSSGSSVAKKTETKKKQDKPFQDEIIIIDSDDEESASSETMQCKRKATEMLADVDSHRPSSTSTKRRVSEPNMNPSEPFGRPSLLLSSLAAPQSSPAIANTAFGCPNELFASTSDPPQPPSAFGRPTLLVSNPATCQQSTLPHTSTFKSEPLFGRPIRLLTGSTSTQFEPDVRKDTIIDLEDEEWATGDDERDLAATGEFDDDDEVLVLDSDDIVVIDSDPPIPTEEDDSLIKKAPDVKPLYRLTSLPPPSNAGSNAFSVLMSSRKENEAWKEATVMEDRTFRPKASNGGRRKAPFYKVLQGMPIAVDAFKYGAIPGIAAYFLTHAHSDHYTNLSSSWTNGPIYCSEGTANLIIHMLRVDTKWVNPLPMDTPTIIPNTDGVQVTLIEANHCPGSSLFFFEGKQTVNAGDSTFKSIFVGSPKVFRYLHCGDFRASPQHVLHPAVKGKRIDHVYLDTTYLDPKYTFPPQPLVISGCAELAKRIAHGSWSEKDKSPIASWLKAPASSSECEGKQKAERILMIVGTYSIGKERIVKAMAHALQTKVYCSSSKAAILRCQCDPELHALLTSKPLEAMVHLVPLSMIASDKLKDYVSRFKGHFDRAVGFRPTGWTYTQPSGTDQSPTIPAILSRLQKSTFSHTDMMPARNSTSNLQLYMVPYSEHSSFSELTCFAMSFQWTKMIATVNVGSEGSRAKMAKWVQRWEVEKQKMERDYVVPYRDLEYW